MALRTTDLVSGCTVVTYAMDGTASSIADSINIFNGDWRLTFVVLWNKSSNNCCFLWRRKEEISKFCGSDGLMMDFTLTQQPIQSRRNNIEILWDVVMVWWWISRLLSSRSSRACPMMMDVVRVKCERANVISHQPSAPHRNPGNGTTPNYLRTVRR